MAKRKVSLSGDVELNPGPMSRNTFETISFTNQNFVLRYRMLRYGLQPLDVGGEGNSLFKSISHQLYGDSNHHAEIRATAVRFLSDNPDRSIRKCTSWNQYLCNMSHQGMWADNIVIQAISDSMQLKINIVEWSQTFRETTTIEPTLCNDAENPHVSTCPVSPLENSTDIEHEKLGEYIHLSPKSKRQNRAAYMKEYRKATDSPEKRAKLNENKRKCRAALNTPEKKAKHNADVRSRWATLISPERKAKRNVYDRHHRAFLKDTTDQFLPKAT